MDQQPSFIETVVSNQTPWFESCVLGCIIMDKGFRAKSLRVMNIDPLTKKTIQDFTSPIDHALLEALKIFISCSGRGFVVPSADFIGVILTDMASKAKLRPSEINDGVDRFNQVCAIKLSTVLPIANQGLAIWLGKQRTARVVQEHTADPNWSADDMHADVRANLQAVNRVDGADTFIEFGYSLDNQILDVKRIEIPGLPGLSKHMGGGLARGEGNLIVAPQGSGKTIFACQVGSGLVIENELLTGIIATTEQSSAQLEPRVVSCHCGVPYNRIMDRFDESLLLPHEKTEYRLMRQALKGRLFWEDWNKEDRSRSITSDIYDVVHQRQDQLGKPIDFFILDWIGGALGATDLKNADKIRHIYQMTADTLFQLAKDENMIVIAMAQAAMATSQNTIRVDATKIAECKSMGANATNVVGITAMYDENAMDQMVEGGEPVWANRQFFYASKTRMGPGGKCSFLRKYEYQKMVDPMKK